MSSRRDDRELVRRLLARDGEAWRTFVTRFQRLVHARVAATARECHLAPQPSDLEDVVAEVFSALLANDMSSLRRFEGRSRLSTWLTVVARRVALKRLRRSGDVPLEGEATAAESVVDDLVAAEELERLGDGLDELGERDRALLRMIYEDGLSHREVAERLGVSPNSIGSLLQRARRRLRDRLVPESDRFEPRPTPLA